MIDKIAALYVREMRRFFRSRFMWLMVLIQPLMWLLFFGSSFSQAPRHLQTYFQTDNYIAFIIPGQISIAAVFTAMFSSMSLIQDRRLGYLKRILTTPTRRSAIFYAKGGATRGLIQAPVILLLSLPLGVVYNIDWTGLAMWVLSLALLGIGFSSLYTMVTTHTSDWRAPGVVANLLNMPLMFSSTALFPQHPAGSRR